MADIIDEVTGLTIEENKCLQLINEAWGVYTNLPKQHPSELEDFCNSIHILQQLLTIRIARRLYPKGWVNYGRIDDLCRLREEQQRRAEKAKREDTASQAKAMETEHIVFTEHATWFYKGVIKNTTNDLYIYTIQQTKQKGNYYIYIIEYRGEQFTSSDTLQGAFDACEKHYLTGIVEIP